MSRMQRSRVSRAGAPARLVFPAVLAGAAALLSACSLLPGASGDAEPPAPAPAAAGPTPTTDAARDDLNSAKRAVEGILAGEKIPTAKAIFGALEKAGFEADQLAATLDRTPLDTGVDSQVFAVRIDSGCIIGEARKGKVSMTFQSRLASTDACLLGEVERPEGAAEAKGEQQTDEQKRKDSENRRWQDISEPTG